MTKQWSENLIGVAQQCKTITGTTLSDKIFIPVLVK